MSIFDKVAFPKHKRNVFNLSHEFRTDAKFGQLIPIFCEEVLPGDTWQSSTQLFVRAMPMIAPLMHRVNIYTHFFFVPNRLVWDEWKTFITGGEDGTEEPVFPTVRLVSTNDGNGYGLLADCLGVGNAGEIQSVQNVNALPFRAYNLIWNEYYRDQNLQPEIEFSKDSGFDMTTPTNILLRNWEKDYFTSALPWTQRGPEVVNPVSLTQDLRLEYKDNGNPFLVVDPNTGDPYENTGQANLSVRPNDSGELVINNTNTSAANVHIDPNGNYVINNVTESLGISINELRRAIALQNWREANARGGARYIEQIFSHFGIMSSDARLQRPEFLGGGRQPLSISEVLQTSQSTDSSDLGEMAGHGVSAATTKQFRRFFEEHGYIIGIMSIMPKTSYMQGTRRFFSKFDKFDYAFPEFANLGEQEIWNSEIFAGIGAQVSGPGSGTFGYQSRYAEYKYIPNSVHGELKKPAFAPWTLVRKFSTTPVLNGEFIDVDTREENLGRIFPVTNGTQFIVQCYHNTKAVRILPKHVIPSL